MAKLLLLTLLLLLSLLLLTSLLLLASPAGVREVPVASALAVDYVCRCYGCRRRCLSPSCFGVSAVAGIPPVAGAPTVTHILSATVVSAGSDVPACCC